MTEALSPNAFENRRELVRYWAEHDTYESGQGEPDDPHGRLLGYIRFPVDDPEVSRLLQQIKDTALVAQPYDYQTVKLQVNVGSEFNDRFLSDITDGFAPRVALVRSSYGFPATPEDGVAVWNVPYNSVTFFTTPAAEGQTAFDTAGSLRQLVTELTPFDHDRAVPDFPRPLGDGDPALYDRGLPGGRWYYYALFLYVTFPDPETGGTGQHWIKAAQSQALIPLDYKHRVKLYDFLPPYYQSLDIEYIAGTGRKTGTLQDFMNVIGFELDYVRTLAEGIENIYNLDQVNQSLVNMLGLTNFGVQLEGSLGDPRYRSLVSGINRLFLERGSARCTTQLASISSKYFVSHSGGVNLLRLGDDSQFFDGTGSWAVPPQENFDAVIVGLGGVTTPATPTFVPTIMSPETVYSKRSSAMKITAEGPGDGVVLTCGYGVGSVENRFHNFVDRVFTPYYHGVRCTPGIRYTFSFYLRLDDDAAGDPGDATAGLLWFKVPQDVLNTRDSLQLVDVDFISLDESTFSEPGDSDTLLRVFVEAVCPETDFDRWGHVYAVPAMAFTSYTGARYVSSAMVNERFGFSLTPATGTDRWLTLGDSAELLDSGKLIGGPR